MRTAELSVSLPSRCTQVLVLLFLLPALLQERVWGRTYLLSCGSSENHPWSTFQSQREKPKRYICVPIFLPEGFVSHILPSWENMFNSLLPVAKTWKNTLFPFLLHFLLCFLPFQTLTAWIPWEAGVGQIMQSEYTFFISLNELCFSLFMNTNSRSCYCIDCLNLVGHPLKWLQIFHMSSVMLIRACLPKLCWCNMHLVEVPPSFTCTLQDWEKLMMIQVKSVRNLWIKKQM